jgi:hypothetical protein
MPKAARRAKRGKKTGVKSKSRTRAGAGTRARAGTGSKTKKARSFEAVWAATGKELARAIRSRQGWDRKALLSWIQLEPRLCEVLLEAVQSLLPARPIHAQAESPQSRTPARAPLKAAVPAAQKGSPPFNSSWDDFWKNSDDKAEPPSFGDI